MKKLNLTIKQNEIPFWIFMALKVIGFVILFGKTIFEFIMAFIEYPTQPRLGILRVLMPADAMVPWEIYWIVTFIYALQLRKKSLLWATAFASIEWVYLLILFIVSALGLLSGTFNSYAMLW